MEVYLNVVTYELITVIKGLLLDIKSFAIVARMGASDEQG